MNLLCFSPLAVLSSGLTDFTGFRTSTEQFVYLPVILHTKQVKNES